MPTLLRELVKRIVDGAPDCRVVEELPDADLFTPELRATEADFVIVGADEAPEHAIGQLLAVRCELKVLGLSSDGRRALLHELRPHKVPLGELSPGTLLEVMRGGGTSTGEGA
jgi:hypothetical protein